MKAVGFRVIIKPDAVVEKTKSQKKTVDETTNNQPLNTEKNETGKETNKPAENKSTARASRGGEDKARRVQSESQIEVIPTFAWTPIIQV